MASSVFFDTRGGTTLRLKEEFFITVGRYGISLTKSCLLNKTHSVEPGFLMKLF